MLLTMIVTGTAVSWEHGLLLVDRMLRGFETMGW
jgi:hypothetical protein